MILNRQRRVRVPLASLKKFLGQVRRVVDLPASSLTVCLVTDAQISRWNRTYRGKVGPTDVLSFPACGSTNGKARRNGSSEVGKQREKWSGRGARWANAHSSASYLGDIAISPAVARRNAHRFGRTLEEEMRILILHGILHLMGYDHEADSGEMDRLESRLRHRLRLA